MGTLITAELAARLLKDQAANLPKIGDIGLFGDAATEADVIRSLENLARNASHLVASIGKVLPH